MEIDELRHALSLLGQQHLLQFWEELTEADRGRLLEQLQQVAHLGDLFAEAERNLNEVCKKLDDLMKPVPIFASEEGTDEETWGTYRKLGLERVARSEVAVLVLAGGQGTRLEVPYPKGMFPGLNLLSGKSLFQLQAERIRRLEKLAEEEFGTKCKIFWYIMTSEATHDATETFLKKHHYFGLNGNNVTLFKQGRLPCFDFNGKILLENKNSIALSPDGNGGLYSALKKNNILEHMTRHGVRYVHAHSVDNILVKVADPLFIGYCVKNNADCGAKVVKKSSPTEALGVVCTVNDIVQVVEYSEITKRTAELRDGNGELVFRAGNICNHFFTVEFLAEVCSRELKLHVAQKKIPYVDSNGEKITPSVPNGIKIEKFIFDVFEFAKNFVTWEVRRETDFSPLKNCEDVLRDCPSTVRADLLDLHRKYVEDNGGRISEGVRVEVSPLLSYAGEGLGKVVDGRIFEKDTVLLGDQEECIITTNGICDPV